MLYVIKMLILLFTALNTPSPTTTPSAPIVSQVSVWDKLAQCESSGNWSDTAGQFEGGLQFTNATWLEYGGGSYAHHAYDATREQQIEIAEKALAGRPDWSAWPTCSKKLGLR